MNMDDLKYKTWRKVTWLLGPVPRRAWRVRRETGLRLDLRNPTTISDKVSWLELRGGRRLRLLMAMCTDKVWARDYVASKGLAGILVPMVGGPWASADDIDFSRLPDRFVLKAAHGCAMNVICEDRAALDEGEARAQVAGWLARDYRNAIFEPHYLDVPRRAYCEALIGGADSIVDYKFVCLNGEPAVVQTIADRTGDRRYSFHDLGWNDVSGHALARCAHDAGRPRPQHLEEMAEVARVLSADFDFVRVDLYDTPSGVLFGELTFTPDRGVMSHYSDEFQRELGARLRITDKSL